MRTNVRGLVRTSSFVPTIPILDLKPNEASYKSTLPDHGTVMIDDDRETRISLFSRFICLLLSSCEDITTDCDDCHAGVPQCKVGSC